MKTLIMVLSASAILSTVALAESAGAGTQIMQTEREQVQNEVQNRFRNMNTDQLLEKRGTMSNQRERDQLHQELQNRVQTMTEEQKRKFNNKPENSGQNKAGTGGGMGSGMGGGAGGGMGGGRGGR